MSRFLQRSGLDDRRLVTRVLHRVTGGTVGCHVPRLNDLDPWFIGDDWVNCALVRVRRPYRHSEFMVVGDNLSAPEAMLDGEPIWKCQATTLLGLTLAYLEQAVEERSFLLIEGAAIDLYEPILYRSLIVPLSEDDFDIGAALIAANSRRIGEGEHANPGARLAWAHRFGTVPPKAPAYDSAQSVAVLPSDFSWDHGDPSSTQHGRTSRS